MKEPESDTWSLRVTEEILKEVARSTTVVLFNIGGGSDLGFQTRLLETNFCFKEWWSGFFLGHFPKLGLFVIFFCCVFCLFVESGRVGANFPPRKVHQRKRDCTTQSKSYRG